MFKSISHRVTVGFLVIGAGAQPLIMPYGTAHAAGRTDGCDDGKQQLILNPELTQNFVNQNQVPIDLGNTQNHYTVSDDAGVMGVPGMQWRVAKGGINVTNDSPYVISDIYMAQADLGVRNPSYRPNPFHAGTVWDDAQQLFINDYSYVGSPYDNPKEPNLGKYVFSYNNPDQKALGNLVYRDINTTPIVPGKNYTYVNMLLTPGWTSVPYSATTVATGHIPTFTPNSTVIKPGEQSTAYMTSWREQSRGSYDMTWNPFVVGTVHCNPTVPAAPSVQVECGPNNDIVTEPEYDHEKITATDSGWVNGHREITYAPKAPYAQFEDGTTSKVYSYDDTATVCKIATPAKPEFNEVCGPNNDNLTFAEVDPAQVNTADTGWVDGKRTITYTTVNDFTVFADGNRTVVYSFEDHSLTCNGRLSGAVYWDNDNSGTPTIGDAYYGGATVIIKDATGAVVHTLTTDANGFYDVSVAAGEYNVSIVLPNDAVATTPASVDVNVARDVIKSTNFGVFKPGKGAGPITDGGIITATPIVQASASLITPISLPHTGGRLASEGLMAGVLAAIATYGAVFMMVNRKK